MRLSAEFIVKRITRPFGTLGFSVNAGSGTYGGAMRKLPSTFSRTGTSGGALAGRCACNIVTVGPSATAMTTRRIALCLRIVIERTRFAGPSLASEALRKVQHRVLLEEVERADGELVPHRRHHRPVLGARDVVKAERVPAHDVGVRNRAVRLGPHGQAVVGIRAGGIGARGVALGLVVRRDPELMLGKRANSLHRDRRRTEWIWLSHPASVRTRPGS